MTAIAARCLSAARWMRVTGIATLVGLVLGALGPFGSYLNDGILVRLAYWVGSTWVGLVLYGGGVVISRRLAEAGSWRRWALLGLCVPAASLPQTIATRAAAFLIWPDLHRHGPGWWAWYGQVTTIGALAVLGTSAWLDARSRRPVTAPLRPGAVAGADGRAVRPVGRPIALPGDVIALQMEDHYVRVHRRAGSALVHMPLAQAIEQTAALDGLRTHRSWWVARHAVERVEGTPRAMRLRLVNGVSAPVARSAVAMLREAGWFEGTPVGGEGRLGHQGRGAGNAGKGL